MPPTPTVGPWGGVCPSFRVTSVPLVQMGKTALASTPGDEKWRESVLLELQRAAKR